ncbi:MAG: CarD family transcriptional regulator [Alphaproteobacteria bacterium]|nr:CarD family transcriptional regulator [Alphaproteobacteria bacterium]
MTNRSLFEIGEWVVYPSHGVGQLTGIDSIEVNGSKMEFYVILFPKNKLLLKLPVKKAISAGLRNVLNQEDLNQIFLNLSQKVKKKRMMWSKRAQEYELKINSGDPMALAETLKELHKTGGTSMQSFSERQIYQKALERLATEISIAENADIEDVAKRIETTLQEAA